MIRIKICGITNLEDARIASDLGADALGFVFYEKSPRHVSRDLARKIVASLPPFTTPVGLFVNESPINIRETVEYCNLQAIQLHGEESPELCDQLKGLKIIKAIRVIDREGLREIDNYRVSAILLDTYSKKSYGGTGRSFDWKILTGIGTISNLILAGGLTPGNVSEAIRTVNPYAVDVSSGVEKKPGKKDLKKIKEFIKVVKLSTKTGDN